MKPGWRSEVYVGSSTFRATREVWTALGGINRELVGGRWRRRRRGSGELCKATSVGRWAAPQASSDSAARKILPFHCKCVHRAIHKIKQTRFKSGNTLIYTRCILRLSGQPTRLQTTPPFHPETAPPRHLVAAEGGFGLNRSL